MLGFALAALVGSATSAVMGEAHAETLQTIDQHPQTELRMRFKKAPGLNGTSFSFDMLDTSVLDAGIHRRQAQGPLVAACSNNGWLETINGRPSCNCQDPWTGRSCHEECNGHGELQDDGATCTCDENWTSDERYPDGGSTQCNMVTCRFSNMLRTLPGYWYNTMDIDSSCGLAPRQVYPYAKRDAVGSLRHPVLAANRMSELRFYPENDNRVFFLEDDFRWMTQYTLVALNRLAGIVSETSSVRALGSANWRDSLPPVVVITSGWSEVPSEIASMTAAERRSLTYEGRQISFILVRRSIAESTELMALCVANFQGVHQDDPRCGNANDDILFGDIFLRRSAEWAWEAGFNWLQHDYNVENSTNPTAGITAATVIHGCGGRLDLAFLLDGSGSVDMAGWNDQLNFVKAMGARFNISDSGTHIAVATFAGPRTAHFTTNETHVTTTQTFRQCQVDADCHDTYTIQEERCNTRTNQCERVNPRHCNNGEWYGNVSNPDGTSFEVCICQAGRQCTAESLQYAAQNCNGGTALSCVSGCRRAAIADMLGGCAYNESTGHVASDTCELDRVFYDPDCASCGCMVNEGEGDYMWNLGHSAWTDADFNSFHNIDTLQDAIDTGLDLTCPSVYSPEFETNKPDWCYPAGASHLKFGLLHVADDVFVEERGMRSFTEGVPRVLITLSDGKANPHFEADEWARFIKDSGIRMFSIGMEDDDSNYLEQLEVLASHPTDRHMFQLDGTDHLQEIVDALSWDVCETAEEVPPGIIIDTEVDAGAADYFQFPCSVNAEWVTVVVDSEDGNTQVVVATTPNPSIYDNHVSIDTSDTTHKVIRFLNQGRTVYAAVQSSTTATARFNISIYIDGVFRANQVYPEWPNAVPEDGSGTPIYTPTMNSSVTVPFDFTILSAGASADYFTLLDATTGAVGLTTAGYAAFTLINDGDSRDAASFVFEMYVNGTGANSSCVAGQQVVTFSRVEAPSPTWTGGDDARNIDTLRQYVGLCAPYEAELCPWPRTANLIPAVNGTSVYTLEISDLLSGDSVELSISSDNADGVFGLAEVVDRRSRRQVGASVTSGSGRVNIVVADASRLTLGQTYALTIQSEFLNGVTAVLPDLTVNINGLVAADMTPHFESGATDFTVDLAVTRSFTVNVDNPDNLDFTCELEGPNPAGFTAIRAVQRCLVLVPTTAPNGATQISLRLSLDDAPCWPDADPYRVTVTVAGSFATWSPTTGEPTVFNPFAPTTGEPTAFNPSAPTTGEPTVFNPSAPTTVAPTIDRTFLIDPELDAYGNQGEEDDTTAGGEIIGVVLGIVFCLLIVGLLAMWMFNKEKEVQSGNRETIANPTYMAAGAPPAGTGRVLPSIPGEGVYGDDNNYADVADLSAVSNPMYGMDHGGVIPAGGMYDSKAQSTGYLDVGYDTARPATVSAVGNPMYGMQDGSPIYSDGTPILNSNPSHGAALNNAMYQGVTQVRDEASGKLYDVVTTESSTNLSHGAALNNAMYQGVTQVRDEASGKLYDVVTTESSTDAPNAQTLYDMAM